MRSSIGRLSLLVVLVLVTAGCDWTTFGFAPSGGRYNNGETEIGVGNVATLTTAWTASGNFSSSPAIAGGVVYAVAGTQLQAFSANGTTGCSGSPASCTPLWTAEMGGGLSTPAVADGAVYVGSDDGHLYAFDAAGNTNCSGSPKTCTPLWKGSAGAAIESSPVVQNGVVFVGSNDGNLYAFDAFNTAQTGEPLWIAPTGYNIGRTTPAVVHLADRDVVFIANENAVVYAFDADGGSSCAGFVIQVCEPLWKSLLSDGSLSPADIGTALAVVNQTLYITTDGPSSGVFEFDCSSTPFTGCAALRHITEGEMSSPAVANGLIYYVEGEGSILIAADVSNLFPPKWNADLGGGGTGTDVFSSPAVANGVVYTGDPNGGVQAFNAADGTHLWSGAVGGQIFFQSPAVAHGVLYMTSSAGLTAFQPAST